MRLMLLRHAKAEKAEPGQRDQERSLNARGRSDAETIGAYMARHKLLPDLAVVSSSRRTRETWERLFSVLAAEVAVSFEDHLYNARTDAILAVAKQTKSSVRTLLLIGHNPGFHDAARLLIASGDVEARERLNENLPTSGLVVIDFAGKDWRKLHAHGGRLEHFVTPRTLAEAGRV